MTQRRITIADIRQKKGAGNIVSLTAYTTPIAKLMDAFTDMIIVGDSLGMVAYGMSSTLPVTLDMMIQHGRAVVNGTQNACVIVDMPFCSYKVSKEQAFESATRILVETGAQGVKMEGGDELTETVRYLTKRGIPVMPHIGLKPQHLNTMGGFKVQGKDERSVDELVQQAQAFEQAGAFAILIEGVYERCAATVVREVALPVIGIGASPECDGQVLVTEDMLGMTTDYMPKFAKQYADISSMMVTAFSQFEQEVRGNSFPTSAHCYQSGRG